MSRETSGIEFSLLIIDICFLLLMVMDPLYLFSFNLDLVLVLLYLAFDFFNLFVPLSSVFKGFIFPLLGLRSSRTLLNILKSRLLLLPYCTTGVDFFVDYSF
jgi:hypothetical protein